MVAIFSFLTKISSRSFWQTALAVGCGAALLAPFPGFARTLSEIKKTKELRACLSPLDDFLFKAEPAGCRDNCTSFGGVTYETSVAFAKAQGVALKVVVVNWDEQFYNDKGVTVREEAYTPALLASGKCDVYPTNLTKNEWRMKKMDHISIFPNRMLVVTKKERKKEFPDLASLGGKTIATVKDTSYHTWLQETNNSAHKANPIKIKLVVDTEMGKVVNAGEADATLMDSDFAVYNTRTKFRDLTTVMAVGEPQEVGWMVRKDAKDLTKAAEDWFKKETANPNSTLNNIWKKYFGVTLQEFHATIKKL